MKIRNIFFSASLIVAISAVCASPLSERSALKIEATYRGMPGAISVELINASNADLLLWKDSNSWGNARWKIVVVNGMKVDVFYQSRDSVFTRNVPSFDVIKKAGAKSVDLNLNDGSWRTCRGSCPANEKAVGKDALVALSSNDVVTVIYDVPRSSEAIQMRVWNGVVYATVPQKAKRSTE